MTPGGGLNSRIAVWANAVINIPEEFKKDFLGHHLMDQRNANGGEFHRPNSASRSLGRVRR